MEHAGAKALPDRFALSEFRGMVVVPGSRYTSQDFFDLEMERLWPRVWQVACREEEIANPGDFLEYTIGDQSILIVRSRSEHHHRLLQCLSRTVVPG